MCGGEGGAAKSAKSGSLTRKFLKISCAAAAAQIPIRISKNIGLGQVVRKCARCIVAQLWCPGVSGGRVVCVCMGGA